MANRTISLSPVCDLIRKDLVKKGFPFSLWVQDQLLEWNRAQRKEMELAKTLGFEEEEVKTLVPWHYECRLCKQKGHHHSDCSMYNPEIHGLPSPGNTSE
jgi:hypothetical protein